MKKIAKIIKITLIVLVAWVVCIQSYKVYKGYNPLTCLTRTVQAQSTETKPAVLNSYQRQPFPPPCDPCCTCSMDCCEWYVCLFWVCDKVCCELPIEGFTEALEPTPVARLDLKR